MNLLVAGVFAALSPVDVVRAAAASEGCAAEKFVELPVAMAGRRPLVKAKVNGIEQHFLADSGAILSMISPGLAARLELTPQPAPKGFSMGGVGGSFDVEIATVDRFEIAGRTVRDVTFLIGGGDVGATGILGQNILAMADTQYDLAAGMIRLVKASDCGERAAAVWAGDQPYAAMDIEPMSGLQRHIAGTGSINGVTLRVVFDTGSPTTLLSLDAARRAGISPGQPGVIPAGTTNGLGGKLVQSWLAPSASYRIGGRDMRGDPLRIADIGNVPFDLLIGADFFITHRVYAASSHGRLYFTHAAGSGGASSLPVLASAEAYGRRGAELAGKGDLANAIADFTRAIEMAPDETRYLVQRARARLANRQDLMARNDLDQAIAKQPDMIEARLARAMLLVADKSFAPATEDLEIAARAVPPGADLQFALGALYAGMEAWRRSREQFDQWIAAHPDDPRRPVALNASCWAGAMLNEELPRALEACTTALRYAPDNLDYRDSQAMVMLRLGRLDEAIADYDLVLAKRPDAPWSLYGRGLARIRKGVDREGRADLAAALALMPDLPQKAMQIGLIRSASEPR